MRTVLQVRHGASALRRTQGSHLLTSILFIPPTHLTLSCTDKYGLEEDAKSAPSELNLEELLRVVKAAARPGPPPKCHLFLDFASNPKGKDSETCAQAEFALRKHFASHNPSFSRNGNRKLPTRWKNTTHSSLYVQ
ncbi:hypothetical protein ANCDUO_03711 [Ancylostoma duodenale]|uniref:Uncharacterized protein n=1 Tax=Ancylostoma duodenale TaxID=51022 RepID=A0A0C2D8D1_9BILA|nr:hypothetical protein ANCDUO_03711 [Ancylostoma duodenale]